MGFSVVNSVISLVISPYLFLSYDTAVHVEKMQEDVKKYDEVNNNTFELLYRICLTR